MEKTQNFDKLKSRNNIKIISPGKNIGWVEVLILRSN